MPLTFAKPALMKWNGNSISDHSRSELSISPERIEKVHRMANGTLRKYVVADKRTFSMSWENLPGATNKTVDGFWGAKAIETFYNTVPGAFTLLLTFGDGTTSTYTVVMSKFDMKLNKRGVYDMYDVSVELEEV